MVVSSSGIVSGFVIVELKLWVNIFIGLVVGLEFVVIEIWWCCGFGFGEFKCEVGVVWRRVELVGVGVFGMFIVRGVIFFWYLCFVNVSELYFIWGKRVEFFGIGFLVVFVDYFVWRGVFVVDIRVFVFRKYSFEDCFCWWSVFEVINFLCFLLDIKFELWVFIVCFMVGWLVVWLRWLIGCIWYCV